MKLRVVGFDPSMSAWGISESELDLTTGFLDTPWLTVVEPDKPSTKQVRVNSADLAVCEQLAQRALLAARKAHAIFVECPVGSQSASAMKSYGICLGILGAIRAEGIPLIEVTAFEVKKSFTGNKNATKDQMIQQGVLLYPDANWPRQDKNGKDFKKGDLKKSAEHVADATAAIHAGVTTPLFQNIRQLYKD